MTKTIIGFPRIGANRELKFATENYWKKNITKEELIDQAHQIKVNHWKQQIDRDIDLIPVGDFSFFDNLLDIANSLNIIPKRYQELGLSKLDEYFAQARGYQDDDKTVRALPMKKWFNTNYHYIVPEFSKDIEIKLVGHKLIEEIDEAKELGINPKPVIIGPYTLLKLSRFIDGTSEKDFIVDLIKAYKELLDEIKNKNVTRVQVDEPALSFDLNQNDKDTFNQLYDNLLKDHEELILQTYFGDIRDIYQEVIKKPFAGVGLDLIEGQYNYELIKKYGFPANKELYAGVINGKNIWRNNYEKTIDKLSDVSSDTNIILNTSCSLLHVPYSAVNENSLDGDIKQHLSFAIEKLDELKDLDQINNDHNQSLLKENQNLFKNIKHPENENVRNRINNLDESDYKRTPERSERESIQKDTFDLPFLPTTTIGSFPQTKDVRANRRKFKNNKISLEEYNDFNNQKIERIIKIQEELGLDVLVHGEYERNDMVEYFGEKLDGFVFTQNGWVQSYGTRGVKPPIIWGDISRNEPITFAISVYANNLTDKLVKGMLTGPFTIFNWSFPREDIERKETVSQISLALQDEVLDLESNGIKIIQIDEPALRENLPLRKTDWFSKYLDWAIPSFRLVHSKVQPDTQIHTHMCYSEFGDILNAIDDLDADVISFEASRADFTLINQLIDDNFKTEVGPEVYDIHSPRIPSENEIYQLIEKLVDKLSKDKIWINPDCGLKTRSEDESFESLKNLVQATKKARSELHGN